MKGIRCLFYVDLSESSLFKFHQPTSLSVSVQERANKAPNQKNKHSKDIPNNR